MQPLLYWGWRFGRCRLEGPFRSGRFPDFTSGYPLSLLEAPESEANLKPETNDDVAKKGPQSSPGRPKKKAGGRVVGSVNLRISVTRSTPPATSERPRGGDGKVADGGAIGDEDPPEIGRRRTNTVDRRLRLGVAWVSLARLLDPVSSPVGPVSEGGVKRSSRSHADHPGGDGVRDESEQALIRARSGVSKPSKAKENCSFGPTVPSLEISCWIIWCGSRVASFELCPKTGLPLRPGEWLLELRRGTAWRSCRLVLEVVAAGPSLHHPCFQKALKHWRHLHERHVPEGDGGKSPAAYHILGRVAVGWQVRKREHCTLTPFPTRLHFSGALARI